MSELALPNWITIKRAALPCWRLVRCDYIPPEHPLNNGSVNAYIKAEDFKGGYVGGINVWQDWRDDRASEQTKPFSQAPEFNGEKFGVTFFMSGDSSFNPTKGESGAYSFYIDGGDSDIASGFGLPLKRHVQYLLTFRWTLMDTPPTEPPTAKQWVITEQSAIRIVMEFK